MRQDGQWKKPGGRTNIPELFVGWIGPRVGLGHGSEMTDLQKNYKPCVYVTLYRVYRQPNSFCSSVHYFYGRPTVVRYMWVQSGVGWV